MNYLTKDEQDFQKVKARAMDSLSRSNMNLFIHDSDAILITDKQEGPHCSIFWMPGRERETWS